MKIWDIKPPRWWSRQRMLLRYDRYLVRKFFDGLPTRGVIDGKQAMLLVYNDRYPELSYIITEQFDYEH